MLHIINTDKAQFIVYIKIYTVYNWSCSFVENEIK